MTRTKIDWADFTWNPVWGCRNHCDYCYAWAMARRFGLQVAGRDDFAPTWIERNFQKPMPRKPSRIFVNSMSDVAYWEPEWFRRVADRVWENPQLRFLFLSKEPWRVGWDIASNAMLGYSATKQEDILRLVNREHCVSFLSLEPLHGPINIEGWGLPALRWIIVGAETGNRRERVVPELGWLREIYHFCRINHIPLFFKASLRHLWPAEVEFPQEYPVAPPPHPQAVAADHR